MVMSSWSNRRRRRLAVNVPPVPPPSITTLAVMVPLNAGDTARARDEGPACPRGGLVASSAGARGAECPLRARPAREIAVGPVVTGGAVLAVDDRARASIRDGPDRGEKAVYVRGGGVDPGARPYRARHRCAVSDPDRLAVGGDLFAAQAEQPH